MQPKYAGFWMRVVANLIDRVPLRVIQFLVSAIAIYSPGNLIALIIINVVFMFLSDAVYEIVLTTKYGGTIGKILLNMRVVDATGKNLSYLRSTGRYFAKVISSITLCIGYFMIAFTEKKQGLHDLLAETTVIFEKPKISKILRTGIITVLIVIASAYAIWMGVSQVGVFSAFANIGHPLDMSDPVGSVKSTCEKELFSDYCIVYSAMFNMAKLSDDQFLAFCDLTGGTERSMCITQLAVQKNKSEVCDRLSFSYSRKSCQKGVTAKDFGSTFAKFFADIDRASQIEPPNTLNATGFILGEVIDGVCTEKPTKQFLRHPDYQVCYLPVNVSVFSRGDDALNEFEMEIKITNATGQYVEYRTSTWNDAGRVILANNTLDGYAIQTDISEFNAGIYNITLIVHDDIGQKQISFHDYFEILNQTDNTKSVYIKSTDTNISITYEESTEPYLLSYSAFLGEFKNGKCNDVGIDSLNVLLPKVSKSDMDFLCIQPLNVTGFALDADNNAHFKIGYKVKKWGSDSETVVDSPPPAGYTSKKLADDMLNGEYVIVVLMLLDPGTYFYEVTVYDTIAGTNTVVTDQFAVTN